MFQRKKKKEEKARRSTIIIRDSQSDCEREAKLISPRHFSYAYLYSRRRGMHLNAQEDALFVGIQFFEFARESDREVDDASSQGS